MSKIDNSHYTRTRWIRWIAFSAPVFALFDWAFLAKVRFDPDTSFVLAWVISVLVGVVALVVAWNLPERDYLSDREKGINDDTTALTLCFGALFFVLELLLLVGVWSL
ncbi:MAG: hypothetical protein Q8P13_02730 [bacterium]|nr:hypothetical protein [bacterium]